MPISWIRELLVDAPLDLTLVVHAVKSNHSLKENVEFGMTVRIFRDFEQGLKNVGNDLRKVINQMRCLVYIIQSRYLYKPAHVGREQLVVHNPGSELVPLLQIAAINGDSPFYKLVLAGFEIRNDFFGNLCEVATVDEIVRLKENRS